MAEARILMGRIGRPHGIKGEVKVSSFTAAPLALADYSPLTMADGRAIAITALRAAGGGLIARIAGVSDRSGAEALAGAELFIDRARLPAPDEGEFYHADLIGLEARDPSGASLGRVKAVHDFGAGDILEIEGEGAPALLLPFTDDLVPEVNVAAGYLRLALDAVEGRP